MSLINALGNTATEDTAQEGTSLLRRMESGTVTTTTTVGTITNMGSGRDAGQMMINPINRTSWALNHRSRIS